MGRQSRDHGLLGNWLLALALALAAPALAACGDDEHSHDDHDHEHEGEHVHGPDTDCGRQENCMDTVTLAEGLEVEGEDEVFSVTVVSHNELSKIDNEWVVEVSDAEGERVEEATVTVSTFSVDCVHPGPAEAAAVTANEEGNYVVEPAHGHGGPWNTILEISAGGETDTVTVPLCVPGEEHEGGVVDGGHQNHEE